MPARSLPTCIVRGGSDASSNVIRRAPVYRRCGRRGAVEAQPLDAIKPLAADEVDHDRQPVDRDAPPSADQPLIHRHVHAPSCEPIGALNLRSRQTGAEAGPEGPCVQSQRRLRAARFKKLARPGETAPAERRKPPATATLAHSLADYRRQKSRCVAISSASSSGKGPFTATFFCPDESTVREGRCIVGFRGSSPVSSRIFASSRPWTSAPMFAQ
jgi:hypothetical protein